MTFVEEEFSRLERWVWLAVGILVLTASGCWVYRAHAAADEGLRAQLDIKAESLKTLGRARDSVGASVARLERYAALVHDSAARADQRADSLTRLAERHRTFRLRVIDPTHVAVTASDTQRLADVREVPIQVTEQLALDSAALQAQGTRGVEKDRDLAVRLTEISALHTAVHLDTLALRQKDGTIAALTAAKTPRLTFREGTVLGVALAIAVKIVFGLLVH